MKKKEERENREEGRRRKVDGKGINDQIGTRSGKKQLREEWQIKAWEANERLGPISLVHAGSSANTSSTRAALVALPFT